MDSRRAKSFSVRMTIERRYDLLPLVAHGRESEHEWRIQNTGCAAQHLTPLVGPCHPLPSAQYGRRAARARLVSRCVQPVPNRRDQYEPVAADQSEAVVVV